MNTDQTLIEEFVTHHSVEAARIIEQLNTEQSLALIKSLPIDLAVNLFKKMEQFAVTKCIESMEVENSVKIIEKLPAQLGASILRRVNNDLRELILAKVPVQISLPLNKMLSFSTSSVGASMNPLVPALPEDISIEDAKKRIKKHKQQLFHYIFITRRDNRFVGIVKLEDLINGDSKVQLGSIMNTDVPHLPASTDFLKILNHPGWIEYAALPVVDRLDNFLGAISHGDVRRIENAVKFKVPSQTTITSNALGELYKIGLESLLYSSSERTIKERQK